MEILGYAASLLIGISLGLIGGGGSILTVPVLVYLFHVDAAAATFYSLFVVGITSLVGSVSFFRKGQIDLRTAMIFGIPSVVTVYLTRLYIFPAVPDTIISAGTWVLSKDMFLMVTFAVLMVAASYSMIKKCRGANCDEEKTITKKSLPVLLFGAATGLITGMLGAGGGFIIIPALVTLLGLDIRKAIGTSLFIIAVNSLFGFTVSIAQFSIEWALIIKIALLAIAGLFVGMYISARTDGKKLKPAFGYFVLVMGVYILLKEISNF